MKPGYIIEHGFISRVNNIILVYNYGPLNLVNCLPSVEHTLLLEYKSDFLIGMWKIKNKKL